MTRYLCLLFLLLCTARSYSRDTVVTVDAEPARESAVGEKPAASGDDAAVSSETPENPFAADDGAGESSDVPGKPATSGDDAAVSSETPENPFAADDGAGESSDVPENPFASDAGVSPPAAPSGVQEKKEKEQQIDLLIDLGMGASLSRFFINPEDITSRGAPAFLFNPGVIIPFARNMYAGIALRYMQLSVDFEKSSATVGAGYPKTSVRTYTNEKMTFVSLPLKLGKRFDVGPFIPYIFAAVEPAYLLGSNQFISKEIRTIFADAEYYLPGEKNTSDRETTNDRTRVQMFLGGGAGFEIIYGYGSVYFEGCCQYGLFDADASDALSHSTPWRDACRVVHFPVALGIRFYL